MLKTISILALRSPLCKSAFIISLLLSLISCSKTSNKKTLKLAHGLDVTHTVHKSMVLMAQLVHRRSGGTLSIDVYPNQQLGTERQCLELLQIGSLSMAKVSGAVIQNFAPQYQGFEFALYF